MRLLTRFILALTLIAGFLTAPAQADPADISAVSRSVVRIVLVAEDGDRVFYVGHGSGIAVNPETIVTNAHVVELAREDSSIVLGIVPSQGGKSYGGKIIAYSPANDLAVIRLEEGRLPPAAIYGGSVPDGSSVFAIGYPGSVDRAQGLDIGDVISPMAPVKSPGVVSGGRTARQFETLLHTAPMASGNSGGPLVDACGRIVGINSFGSLSDGNDAEFGFAVSNREVAALLRRAKVDFNATTITCRSNADLSRDEDRRQLIEIERDADERRARLAAEEKAQQSALRQAYQDITTARENYIAIAALLLALTVLAAGASWILFSRDRRNPAIGAAGAAAFLLLGAVILFISRPSFADATDRAAAILKKKADKTALTDTDTSGKKFCAIDMARSRITVSDVPEVELDWQEGGCVNGRTQYGQDGSKWARVLVPNTEETVSIVSYDPDRGIYRTKRYLLDFDTMKTVREIRARYSYDQCTSEPATLAELEDMQKALEQALPPTPNEVLVYDCTNVN